MLQLVHPVKYATFKFLGLNNAKIGCFNLSHVNDGSGCFSSKSKGSKILTKIWGKKVEHNRYKNEHRI